MTDLGTLPGSYGSCAYGINDNGQVVGESFAAEYLGRPFVWRSGVMRPLPLAPGDAAARAVAINDVGQVAGYGWDSNDPDPHFRALFWEGDSVIVLATPSAFPTAINNAGVVLLPGRISLLWRSGSIDTLPFEAMALNNAGDTGLHRSLGRGHQQQRQGAGPRAPGVEFRG